MPATIVTEIGIDPGKSGGIAWRTQTGEVFGVTMPDTTEKLLAILQALRVSVPTEGYRTPAYLEKVGGFIKRDDNVGRGGEQPGSAMFVFGEGYGIIKGILAALDFDVFPVRPQQWQPYFQLGTAGEHGRNWKNVLKQKAIELYPTLKITLKNADAVLILSYAVRNSPTLSATPRENNSALFGDAPGSVRRERHGDGKNVRISARRQRAEAARRRYMPAGGYPDVGESPQ